jgi:MoxR-like ATPase
MALQAVSSDPKRAQLQAVRGHMASALLERDHVVDGILSAILARQHVLLLGPPGTAKSALANLATQAIDGASQFSWLLTKFSTPEEIFGPISLSALQQDRVKRLTAGKLPEASIAFLDEIFKSNSAILNSLLTLVNERVYHNDGKAQACPLVSCIGASNETPEDASLGALYDRFALRYWIPRLTESRNVKAFLRGKASVSKASTAPTIAMADLEAMQAEAAALPMSDDVIEKMIEIKVATEEAGFVSSDRRWGQLIALVKARAYLDGADAVSIEHLEILGDAIWQDPKDASAVATIVSKIANPVAVRTAEIVTTARELAKGLGALPSNQHDRATWMERSSNATAQLDEMLIELAELAKRYNNSVKVVNATKAVSIVKTEIARSVAAAYGIK